MVEFLENSLNSFAAVTKKPQVYLSNDDENPAERLKAFLKQTYDFTKNEEDGAEKSSSKALPELIVQDFDLEQIWQQLELQNDSVLEHSLANVSRLVVGKDDLLFFNESTANGDAALEDESESSGDESAKESHEGEDESENKAKRKSAVEDSDSEDSDDEPDPSKADTKSGFDSSDDDSLGSKEDGNSKPGKNRKRTSVVDDEFFKLSEMEDFLNAEEKKLNRTAKAESKAKASESESDDESVDLFNDEDDAEEEATNPKYKEFFGAGNEQPKKAKRNKFFESTQPDSDEENEGKSDNESDSDGENKDVPKSSYELRKERLKKKIDRIENAAISEKPWQLKGEVTADNRPQNSLLEEVVEFDLTARPAPVITEETTLKLEDIIRQRIKDKAFDSVERKAKPVESVLEYKKKLVLDQEKSKVSLAQIYEKEYLKQKEALDPNAEEREPEVPELHKEIEAMMKSLFVQLDALSNFHFTPKPVAPELKVVTNLPAISMEEVAPVATSDATLLAPEEVKRRPRGDVIGQSERTETDKKRERRKKKKKQRIHANARLKKDLGKIGLGNKYSKEKAKRTLKDVTKDKNVDKMEESTGKPVKSSKAFFTQLQEEVQTQIHNRAQGKRKKNQPRLSAKKMKL